MSQSDYVAGYVLGHARGGVTQIYTDTERDPEAVRGFLERAVNRILGTTAEVFDYPNATMAG